MELESYNFVIIMVKSVLVRRLTDIKFRRKLDEGDIWTVFKCFFMLFIEVREDEKKNIN